MNKIRILALLGALLATTTEVVALDYYPAKLVARSPARTAQAGSAGTVLHRLHGGAPRVSG